MLHFTQDDGYRLHCAGHIESVEVATIIRPAGFIYVKAKCKPEQRQTAERYEVVLALRSAASVEVTSATCSCVAG